MNTDLISVIIPTYKPANYIYRCLESVARQDISKQRLEVIIVLNGCNEPYYTDIKLFLRKKFQGIKTLLLQTDVAGVSNARNIGLDNAQGEYITFIDDDDWVSHNFLRNLSEKSDTNKIVVSNILLINEQNKQQESCFLNKTFSKNKNKTNPSIFSARGFMSNACEKLIPLNIIQEDRFPVGFELGEDSIFMFTISKRINKIELTSSDTIYYINKRASSSSRRFDRPFTFRLQLALKQISAYVLIYANDITNYNALFFLTRIAASLRKIVSKKYI